MRRLTKVLPLLVLLAGVSGTAAAATYEIGVKGGVAIEKLGGDDVDGNNTDSRTGFAGGGYFQAGFNRNFGLRVEALYFMKGASADSASFEATFKLDYLEFPVLLVANVPLGETSTLSFFGGPTFGFNTKADLEGSVGGFSATVDVGDYFTEFDFGLTFGAGIGFDVGSVLLGFDGRYGFGLTSIAEDDPSYGDADVKTKGFAFMGSVGFPLGAK